MQNRLKTMEILLIEDNPGDVRLTQEALKLGQISNRLSWAKDGEEALAFLRREEPYQQSPRPDIILLDLNLPKHSGQEILKMIKSDEKIKSIPVIILTSSKAEEDIHQCYQTYANCYISKPVAIDKFIKVVQSIDLFWLTIATLPQ